MNFVRLIVGSLFVAALLLTAAEGRCAVKQQIAERTKQYQESLLKRAQELSPALQSKIESQVRRTVSTGLVRWKKGEVNIRIALPCHAEIQNVTRFVKRHLPFSGSPAGSFEFGIGTASVAIVVSSVQQVVKSLAVHSVYAAIFRCSLVRPLQYGGTILSYFVRVVGTIVLRR